MAQQETIAIGTAEVNFSFRGSKTEQMGRFAVQICNPGESAILFSNDASDAEDSATTIAECIDNFEVTDEISDFINFIRSEIHPEYPLIECLRKGVAFHYGNMPSIIRSTVERFFKNGQIRYLCSTSTLLQGVNLPAKHIVIQDPLLGTQKMGRADFRNLAGRAGRLLKEFHGNVWCLRPGDWNNQCYKGEDLQEIRGAMDDVMLDGGTLIGSISEGLDVGAAGELGDAAFARLYHEIKEAGAAETFSTYQSEENEYLLRANIAQLDALKIDIPSEILEAHRSLRPDLLQNLLNKLRDLHSLENAVLINPHESGGKERMIFALSMINDAFATPMLDKYLNWVSTTAHNWVWGTPIGEMLSGRVNFSRKGEPDAKASPIIRALLRLIENEIRYKMVKNFAAYEDLLKLAWFEREGVEHNGIAPYHVYLEFGSSDPASLSLMALGLSRFTAIKLKNSISWNEEHEPEDYLRRLSEIGIKNLRIPLLCKIELLELLGTE